MSRPDLLSMRRASAALSGGLLLTGLLTVLTVLTVLTASGCDLPSGDKTSPNYWSELFLNLYADDIVVGELEVGPPALETPRTVLLITGVTIRAQWFDPIVARLERDGFVPVVYEPPELLSGDLFEASEQLAEVVDQVLADSGQDRIDILAECTGGLIARHYVQSLGGEDKVSRLVTFVSPQHGVAKAPWAALIANWPALHDLSPGSSFLQAVNEAPLPETVPITSIYTCHDEYIQPWETSIIDGATNIGLCDPWNKVFHFETFFRPEVYLIMHEALTRPTGFEPTEEPSTSGNEPTEEPTDEPTSEPNQVPIGGPVGEPTDLEPGAQDDPADIPGDEPGNTPETNTPAPQSPTGGGVMHLGGNPPQAGNGCTAVDSSAAPTAPIILLVALLGLGFLRRRRVDITAPPAQRR